MASSNGRVFNVGTAKHGTVMLPGCKQATLDPSYSIKADSEDYDMFNTVLANEFQDPKLSFQTAVPQVILGIVAGTIATAQCKVADAENGIMASGGGFSIALANAMIDTNSLSVGHREFGSASISFMCYSTDGSTSPLTITAL